MTSFGGVRSAAPAWLAAAGAAASLAGSSLPWWSSGLGSAIAPPQLSALVLSGQFTPLIPRLVGAALLLPLLAVALLVASLGLRRGVRPVRVCAFGCLAAVGAVLLLAPNRGSLGTGGLAVLAGAGLSLGALLSGRPARTGPRRQPPAR
jgi:hypothetical protein